MKNDLAYIKPQFWFVTNCPKPGFKSIPLRGNVQNRHSSNRQKETLLSFISGGSNLKSRTIAIIGCIHNSLRQTEFLKSLTSLFKN